MDSSFMKGFNPSPKWFFFWLAVTCIFFFGLGFAVRHFFVN